MDSLSSSLNPNKRLKEEFVSNLTVSSMLEISALATLVTVLILLRHSVGSDHIVGTATAETKLKKNDNVLLGSKSWWVFLAALLVDFFLVVLPILLFLTISVFSHNRKLLLGVLAEWLYQWVALMTLLLLFCVVLKKIKFLFSFCEWRAPFSQDEYFLIQGFYVVDFTILPRRYAKSETYGTGLMDIGVGSFVLANALVSRQARNISSKKMKTAIQSTSPLIILGFARLLSTTGVDYQNTRGQYVHISLWVHVGEYGVHWNFFFMLVAMSILTSIIDIPLQYCGILGLVILVGHQSCLMQGLNLYLLSEERGTDLISQNKEGLFSVFGYWGIYLVGVQLGNFLFFQNKASIMRSNKWARTRVWLLSILFWFLTVLIDGHVERVSRRMVLGILMLSDFISGSKTSVLEQAFNHNLPATFLLANVLTGLVNLSTDTLFASPIRALSILMAYAFTLCVVIGLVDFYGIRLKFWQC